MGGLDAQTVGCKSVALQQKDGLAFLHQRDGGILLDPHNGGDYLFSNVIAKLFFVHPLDNVTQAGHC